MLAGIIVLASSFFVIAANTETEPKGFHINNSAIITNDASTTYIEGIVEKSHGQKLLVKKGLFVVAEKIMPETGESESFKIKLPVEAIDENKVNVFRVREIDIEDNSINTTERVEVNYIQKKKQNITIKQDKYEMTFPGEDANIAAKSSSGETLTYTSSNPKVVSVDAKGNLTSRGAGEAIITVKQIGNGKYYEAEDIIDVSVKAIDAYTVTYHSSAEKDTTIKQIVRVGEDLNLQENTFENGEHEFLGWARTDDGLVEFEDSEHVEELGKTGDNIDLYAVWTGDGARAAVAWAVRMANDDSFAYGTGDVCHSAGCYYCGTNQRNKPSGYEKTYVCLTFVEAAYAHGAEDPELLSECQAGKRCLAVNDTNFSRYSCWKKIGYTSDLTIDDLEPGDVICFYNAGGYDNGHMEMYAGNGDIVDSAYEGWSADTMALRPGQAARDLRDATSHNGNSYVMRYVGPNAEQ